MKLLNFAIVGCGRISKRHSDLLGLNQIPFARLCAVCDIKLERAESIGRAMNIPFYLDMHQMMETEKIDVVVVLTESGLHSEHVVALAKYGKHIMVEKPMALTLADADKMILE